MSDQHLYQFPKDDSYNCAECGKAASDPAHISIPAGPERWVVWSHEHQGYWPESRCGYVPLHAAGHFTFEEALAIVRNGNYGMGSTPEESMMPVPGRRHG